MVPRKPVGSRHHRATTKRVPWVIELSASRYKGDTPISKRHATTRDLLGLYLTFTPRSRETDLLDADMQVMNPALLVDAIKEAIAVREIKNTPSSEQGHLIHKIYTRKVKEHSSLYPFIFAVENGLRSSLADHSAAKFKRLDWWTLIRDARDAGMDYTYFPNIATVPVNSSFVKAVFRAFENMTNPQHRQSISGANKTDEFYYTLSLGDLWNILQNDWAMTRGMFCSDRDLNMRLDRNLFDNTMRIIKDARNDIYHSNPIKNRSKVVEACERILNFMSFHLGEYDNDLSTAQSVRVTHKINRTSRHFIPAR